MAETRPNSVSNAHVDPTGALADDIGCLSCGYNLRGLQPTGRCPACGTEIDRSLRRNLLRFCSPEWIDGMRRGLTLIIVGAIAKVLASCVTRPFADTGADGVVAALAIGLVASLISLVGAWMLTAPDPGRFNAEPGIRFGQALRWAWTADMIFGFAGHLDGILPDHGLELPAIAAGILQASAAGASVLLLFKYTEQLANRIPAAALVRSARSQFRAWAVVIALLAITMVLMFGITASQTGSFLRGWKAARSGLYFTFPAPLAGRPPLHLGGGLGVVLVAGLVVFGPVVLAVLVLSIRRLGYLLTLRASLRTHARLARENQTTPHQQPDSQ